jgi:hypothetical protein
LPGHETITTTAWSFMLIPRPDARFSHLFALVIHGPACWSFPPSATNSTHLKSHPSL